MTLKNRSVDFWLGVAVAVFLACAAATAYAHVRYQSAETAYLSHLNRVVVTPQAHIAKTLAGYSQMAASRLRVQTVLGALTLLATVNVLVQVARRRNLRVAAEEAAES